MRALITGVTGQDGAYLANLLLEKGYEVFGTHRPQPSSPPWRLERLGIAGKVNLLPLDLTDDDSIERAIVESGPHEIYNLAAQSHVGTSFDMPMLTTQVNALGPQKILGKIRHTSIRFYQASTSEMFGNSPAPQNEDTPVHPVSPYGWSKLYAHQVVKHERSVHGTFAVSGILFNHESPLRGENFVTQKICTALRKRRELVLGDLSPKRDWGHARDYVYGMWLMMQHTSPQDFVLATGKTRSVKDFLDTACNMIDYRPRIRIDEKFIRDAEVIELRGDASKAAEKLGWIPQTSFESLVEEMLFDTSSFSSGLSAAQ